MAMSTILQQVQVFAAPILLLPLKLVRQFLNSEQVQCMARLRDAAEVASSSPKLTSE
jgi:hypothetical protein